METEGRKVMEDLENKLWLDQGAQHPCPEARCRMAAVVSTWPVYLLTQIWVVLDLQHIERSTQGGQ